jgi:hypothetical protein
MKLSKLLMLVAVVALGGSSCAHRKDAKAFEKAFEGSTGESISLVKLHTETDGYAVFMKDSTGEFFAANVDKFDRKNNMTYEQFMAIAVPGVDVVSSLTEKSEIRYEAVEHSYWVSTGGDWEWDEYDNEWEWEESGYWESYTTWEPYTYTWYEGGGFRFETNGNVSKDLETIAAQTSDASKRLLSEAISANYGLSEERSLQLANLAVAWNKLEDSREMTDADKAVFSKEALGASLKDFEKAMEKSAKGDKSDYNALLKKAGETNGVSPEHAEKILTDLFEVAQ